jgi:hypothetical protein
MVLTNRTGEGVVAATTTHGTDDPPRLRGQILQTEMGDTTLHGLWLPAQPADQPAPFADGDAPPHVRLRLERAVRSEVRLTLDGADGTRYRALLNKYVVRAWVRHSAADEAGGCLGIFGDPHEFLLARHDAAEAEQVVFSSDHWTYETTLDVSAVRAVPHIPPARPDKAEPLADVGRIVAAHRAGSRRHLDRSPTIPRRDPEPGSELLVRVDVGWLDGMDRGVAAVRGDASFSDLAVAIFVAFLGDDATHGSEFRIADNGRVARSGMVAMPEAHTYAEPHELTLVPQWELAPGSVFESQPRVARVLDARLRVSEVVGHGWFFWWMFDYGDQWLFSLRVLRAGRIMRSGNLDEPVVWLAEPPDRFEQYPDYETDTTRVTALCDHDDGSARLLLDGGPGRPVEPADDGTVRLAAAPADDDRSGNPRAALTLTMAPGKDVTLDVAADTLRRWVESAREHGGHLEFHERDVDDRRFVLDPAQARRLDGEGVADLRPEHANAQD